MAATLAEAPAAPPPRRHAGVTAQWAARAEERRAAAQAPPAAAARVPAPRAADRPPLRAHARSSNEPAAEATAPPLGARPPASPQADLRIISLTCLSPATLQLLAPAITCRVQRGPASATPMCQVEFEMACAAIKLLKGPVSDEEKLLVYSFYKQATQGDCNIPAPPASDVKSKAKWDAWNGNKGMSKMDAMKLYVAKVEELKKKEAG